MGNPPPAFLPTIEWVIENLSLSQPGYSGGIPRRNCPSVTPNRA